MKIIFTKKLIVGLLLFVGISSSSFAQKGFQNGDKLLNVGVGLNSYYSGGLPFGASFEIGITDDISVGGNIDYFSNTYSGISFTALYFGGRGSYHFNKLLNLETDAVDVYGGAALGYRSFSWGNGGSSDGLDGVYGSGIYLGFFAGGKYYFTPKIGAFTELGAIGSTNIRVGVAFKL